jgi:sigma-B regulation protein RsbU (phosphoserine phosphatase)
MLKLNSLQKRFAVLMLIPVALLMVGMGYAGFTYARKSLVDQWREAVILKLQRAAHHVDMRLGSTKVRLRMISKITGQNMPHEPHLQSLVLDEIRRLEGVAQVDIKWRPVDVPPEAPGAPGIHDIPSPEQTAEPLDSLPAGTVAGGLTIGTPRFDTRFENQTVTLIFDLNDGENRNTGHLKVVYRFDYLINIIENVGWREDQMAYLVDKAGRIITGTRSFGRRWLGKTGDSLEIEVLENLKEKDSGTVMGRGLPPERVIGFYRLMEAPWYLILVSPGQEMLSPIAHFTLYYTLIAAVFIICILLVMRHAIGQTVRSIKNVSTAAKNISRGVFEPQLPVTSQDEVGELTQSFNSMTKQLEERIRLKEAMDLAVEIQQSLLPREMPKIAGLEIAAKNIYSDQTGGDFYDFITFRDAGPQSMGIVVGDVSGHGIPSALLMATIRGFIRQRSALSGGISQIVSDVNRQLCHDVKESGRFVTLFCLKLDPAENRLQWVRAGHDPAIFFDPATDRLEDLKGQGPALGIDPTLEYPAYTRTGLSPGQIIVIFTDGIWECRNHQDIMFGKKAIHDICRNFAAHSAESILDAIMERAIAFQGRDKFEDDATVVVIKINA